jgi:hypothetical protein
LGLGLWIIVAFFLTLIFLVATNFFIIQGLLTTGLENRKLTDSEKNNMNSKRGIAIGFLFGLQVAAFQNLNSCPERLLELSVANRESSGEKSIDDLSSNRRDFFQVIATSCAAGLHASPDWANAAVGSLPEYGTTNAVIQGITVNVADRSQQDAMIDFLVNGFSFKVLRKRIDDPVEDTVSPRWEMF